MQAGKLNKRITVTKYTRVQDEFGGWNNTAEYNIGFWADVDVVKGEIDTISGKRALSTEIKITMRKKSADKIEIGDTIVVSNQTGNYRINDKFESTLDFYTTLMATKVE